jgi:hypothetical protein
MSGNGCISLPVCFSLPVGRQVSFFLLHKQKKEHTNPFPLFLVEELCSFCLDAKRTKKIKPGPKLRRPGWPTHMNTQIDCNYTPD